MKLYIYAITLFLGINTLNAGPKFKNKGVSSEKSSTFGDINFVMELSAFQNSSNRNDKSNKYYGWKTNNNVISSGDLRAVKGGMFTMLGGAEYPNTFRSLGKG